MKRKIILSITIISSFFVGMVAMFFLLSYLPNEKEVIQKVTNEYNIEDDAIVSSVEKVYDAVVVVESYEDETEIGSGTGFVYKKDSEFGYIITNSHVVDEANVINVIFSDGNVVEATLLGKDVFADIAVLSVPVEDVIMVAEIGTSEELKLGSTVFTIGAPMGSDYSGTVTKGILSGKDRIVTLSLTSYGSKDWMMRVLQTDAAINPGNSGGPLLNIAGEVIGINSLKIVVDEVEGMGFAIPIEDAMQYVEELEAGKDISRPLIGIELIDLNEIYTLFLSGITVDDEIENGVVIGSVTTGTPADEYGLKKGDIILKLNDEVIKNKAEFRYELYKLKPNDTITLSILRDEKIKDYELILGDSNN